MLREGMWLPQGGTASLRGFAASVDICGLAVLSDRNLGGCVEGNMFPLSGSYRLDGEGASSKYSGFWAQQSEHQGSNWQKNSLKLKSTGGRASFRHGCIEELR